MVTKPAVTTTVNYTGPSIYARVPVFCYSLQDIVTAASTSESAGHLFDLVDWLPGMTTISGCAALARDAAPVDLTAVPFGHLFEHICIELQTLAGAHVECVRGSCAPIPHDLAVVPYEDAVVCARAAQWATAFMLDRFSMSATGTEPAFDAEAELQKFCDFAGRRVLPAHDRALIDAARDRDVPVMHLVGRTFVLGQGSCQQRISATKTTQTNIISNDLAANKDYCRRLLLELDLPVPRYARAHSRRRALAAAQSIGYPVVVKPVFGSMGEGVTVNVRDDNEMRTAYKNAREFGRSVLIEEMVSGDDYRFLIVDGKFSAAAKRVPAHVIGDGVRTIAALVAEVNDDPRRGTDHNAALTQIEIDEHVETILSARGYVPSSVPKESEVVYLRRNANLSTGGSAVDVTDEVHPANRDVAERAARAIGLDIAGVDILADDISQPMFANGGKICEINSRPGIRQHLWPTEGQERDVASPIIEMLFPPSQDRRIPTAVVVGQSADHSAADLTARLIAHLCESDTCRVGKTASGLVHISGAALPGMPKTLPEVMRRLLLDPAVEAAVFATSIDELIDRGLGSDVLDAAIVLPPQTALSAADTQRRDAALELLVRVTRTAIVLDPRDPGRAAAEAQAEQAGLQVLAVGGAGAGNDGVAEIVLPESGADQLRIALPGWARHEQGNTGIARAAGFACLAARLLGVEAAGLGAALEHFDPKQD